MSEIDISDLKKEALDKGNFPVGSKEPFRVHFAPEVHEGTRAHASADTSVEICGVLVGKWETDTNGPYALITNYIRCDNAAQKHAEVTFTQDSWTQINHEMDTKYQDLRIIGWYHSHPDFGIFLSDRDCFIQQHFFSGPGQVAFVIDPVRHLEGLFEWRNSKPTAMHHYWVGEQVHLGETRPAEKQAPKPGTMDDSEAGEAPESSMLPAGPTEGILNWIVVALACVCSFLLGLNWLHSAYINELNQQRIQAMKHYEMFKVLRPGMEQQIEGVQHNLGVLSEALVAFNELNVEEQEKKQVQLAVDNLQVAMQQQVEALEDIKVTYGHSPQQQVVFEELFRQYHTPPEKKAEQGGNNSSGNQADKNGSTDVGPRPSESASGEHVESPAPSTPQPAESSTESNSEKRTSMPPAESN
ncbi:MAG: Mov34/MPN/PAD-1 family protein [Planctomycetaceae bacterium]